MAEGSAAASVSAAPPPSPAAAALPPSPSRWLRGCWTLAAAAVAGSWRRAGAGPGQTVGWCWPAAGVNTFLKNVQEIERACSVYHIILLHKQLSHSAIGLEVRNVRNSVFLSA